MMTTTHTRGHATGDTAARLEKLVAWYQTLTRESVSDIALFYADNVRFKDPFNDVTGRAAIAAIFGHMFDTTHAPRFEVADRLVDGDQALITWTFFFGLRGTSYEIVGSTHFKFNADGMVVLHRDYWDASEELLQKLPVIGRLIRALCGLFKTRV